MSTFSVNPVQNYLNVSIVINSVNNKYYFPDLPQLRDAKINAMCFYPVLNDNSSDPNSVPLISLTNASYCFLTLDSGNEQIVQNLPLNKLANQWSNVTGSWVMQGNQDGIFTFAENTIVDFSKSFVSVSPTQTITGTLPQSICFGIFYTK
jgi:hypothetical protein